MAETTPAPESKDEDNTTEVDEKTTQTVENDNDDEGQKLSEVEQEALGMGWNPDHDGANFVSAQEFVNRASFFNKIDSQNHTIKGLKDQVAFLIERNEAAEDLAYKKAIRDLKKAKTMALEEDDHAAVTEIDEQCQFHVIARDYLEHPYRFAWVCTWVIVHRRRGRTRNTNVSRGTQVFPQYVHKQSSWIPRVPVGVVVIIVVICHRSRVERVHHRNANFDWADMTPRVHAEPSF